MPSCWAPAICCPAMLVIQVDSPHQPSLRFIRFHSLSLLQKSPVLAAASPALSLAGLQESAAGAAAAAARAQFTRVILTYDRMLLFKLWTNNDMNIFCKSLRHHCQNVQLIAFGLVRRESSAAAQHIRSDDRRENKAQSSLKPRH